MTFIYRTWAACCLLAVVAYYPLSAHSHAVPLLLTEAERAWLQANPEIVIGTDADSLPYAQRQTSGETKGIEAALIARVNALTGANIRLVMGDWSVLLQQAKNQQLHGLSVSHPHAEPLDDFLFTEHVYEVLHYVYVKKDKLNSLQSIADLNGKKVGLQENAWLEKQIAARWPDIQLVKKSSEQNLTLALLNAEVDAVIAHISLHQVILQNLFDHELKIGFSVPEIKTQQRYFIHKNAPELHSIINKALHTISDSEITALLNKWVDNGAFQLFISPQEQAYLKQYQFQRASPTYWIPFSFKDAAGNITGIGEDYWQLIRDKLNLQETLVESASVAELKTALQQGKVALCPVCSALQLDDSPMLSTNSYEQHPIALVTLATSGFISHIEALSDKLIAVSETEPTYRLLQAHYPHLNFLRVADVDAALRAVETGQAFAAAGILPVLQYQLQPYQGQLHLALVSDVLFDLKIRVHAKYANLIPLLNRAIASITPEEHLKIHKRWMIQQVAFSADNYQKVIQVIAIASVLIVLVILWNRRLALEVRQRKHAEHKLRESEEKYRCLFELSDVPMWIIQNDLVVMSNAAAARVLGYDSAQALLECHIADLSPKMQNDGKTSINSIQWHITQAYQNGYLYFDWLYQKWGGETLPAEVSFSRIPYENDHALFCIWRDVSERQHAQGQAHLWLHVFEQAKLGLILSDTKTCAILNANQAVADEYGYSIQEMEMMNLRQLFPVDNNSQALVNLEQGHYAYEAEQVRQDGSRFPVWVESSVIQDMQGNVYRINSMQNISATKYAEQVAWRQQQYQQLLLQLSTDFINKPLSEINVAIQSALEEMARFVNADRAYLFKYDFTANTMSNAFEWCAEGISAQIQNLQNLPTDLEPELLQTHLRGDFIHLPKVSELADSAIKRILQAQDIQSLISVPLCHRGTCLGFIGFDSVKRLHHYHHDEIQLLQLFAQILINVEERSAREREIKLAEARYRNILDSTSEGYWQINATQQIVAVNHAFCDMLGYEECELLGCSPLEFVTDSDYQTVFKHLAELSHRAQWQAEISLRHRNGDTVYSICHATTLHDETNGEFQGAFAFMSNISQCKQAEQQLQETSEHLRSILESMEEMVFVLDAEHQFINFYQKNDDKLLLPPEQFLGKNYHEVLPPHLCVLLDEAIQVVQSKGTQRFEYSLALPNGTAWFSASLSARYGIVGEFDGITVVVRDISSSKVAAEALRASESRYRSLIATMAEGIFMVDQEAVIIECNAAAERILNRPRDKMLGSNIKHTHWLLFAQDGTPLEGDDRPVSTVLKTGRSVRNIVVGLYTPKKEMCWLLVNAEPLAHKDSEQVYGVVVSFADITRRKAAEARLRRNQQRISLMLNLTQRSLEMTEQVLLQTGLAEVAELSHSEFAYLQFIHDAHDATFPAYWATSDSAQNLSAKMQQQALAQTEIWMDSVCQQRPMIHNDYPTVAEPAGTLTAPFLHHMGVPLIEADTVLFVVGVGRMQQAYDKRDLQQLDLFVKDLWQLVCRRRTELALEQARQAAESANHAKSAFLTNMSHELRTPLNAILGFAQVLQQSQNLPTHLLPQVQKIQRGGAYLLTLINDILDISKIEAGRLELYPEQIDLPSFFEDIVDMFQARAEQKAISFYFQLDPHLPLSIDADAKRLRQILLNLLGNAVKFTERGHVTFTARCSDDHLYLTVEDTGIGMSVPDQERIFQPFVQTCENRYKTDGTGLGLAITHSILELMQGDVSVDSRLGEGSRFNVKIPLAIKSQYFEDTTSSAVLATNAAHDAVAELSFSEEWLQSLAHAVALGDRDQVYALLNVYAEQGKRIPAQLQGWVDEYKYPQILAWVEKQME